MLLFDIGANRGDATLVGLQQGYKVVALEPAPRVYGSLVKNFIYNPNVIPLKLAVSDADNLCIDLYEANEDGLSTINKDWLTNSSMPYNGKPFRTVQANTITIDTLASIYGEPDLIKIDVEGAEWSVFKGMTKHNGTLTFEWTYETLDEHQEQLRYLASLGYTEVGPQFITNHLEFPDTWVTTINLFDFKAWVDANAQGWVDGGWVGAGLRPTADVGMCWVR